MPRIDGDGLVGPHVEGVDCSSLMISSSSFVSSHNYPCLKSLSSVSGPASVLLLRLVMSGTLDKFEAKLPLRVWSSAQCVNTLFGMTETEGVCCSLDDDDVRWMATCAR
jgi:hypothetical protein